MGIDAALSAARWLARQVFMLTPPVRFKMEANLRRAFGPALPDATIERLAAQSFESVAAFWTELIYCRRLLSPLNWRRRIRVPGDARWRALIRADRPALLVTTYLGNPVVAACALSECLSPLYVVVDAASGWLIRQEPDILNRFTGLRIVHANDTARTLPSILQAGGRVLFLAGWSQPVGGVEATFLGRRMRHHATIARLAHRHRAEIVPFACLRCAGKPFSFKLVLNRSVRPDPKAPSAAAVTQQYLTSLEAMIHRAAHQYLWTRA